MQCVVFLKMVMLLLFGVATKAISLNEITASDGASNDDFGYGVGISGTTAIVGAYRKNNYQGAAYIFDCPTPSTCTQASELIASDGVEGDYFGWSVSISGTIAIVGAPFKKIGSNSGQGAAYIFTCPTPSTCTQASELLARDGASSDQFGRSVCISGTTAIVGAFNKQIGSNIRPGAAYIFTCPTPSTCTQASELIASDGASNDIFGWSVSISGTTAIVGAPDKTFGSKFLQGAAYIFTCPTPSTCTQASELIASDAASDDQFGSSVSISGTTAIVGALGKTIGSNSTQGAAYIFSCPTPSNCTQASELIASDGASYDEFGSSVSISGTTAIVGALYKTIGSNSTQGAAYIFSCPTPSNCTQASELLASDGAEEDFFGHSVCISGTTAIVGAYGKNSSQGAAYVVDLLSTPTPTPTATSTSTATPLFISTSTSTPTPTFTSSFTSTSMLTSTPTSIPSSSPSPSTSTPTSPSTSTSPNTASAPTNSTFPTESNEITPTPSPDAVSASSSNLSAIVGGVVGGVVGFALLAVVVWMILLRCKGSPKHESDDGFDLNIHEVNTERSASKLSSDVRSSTGSSSLVPPRGMFSFSKDKPTYNYHVFISYRRVSDRNLANDLYLRLTKQKINGMKVQVFFDQDELKPAEEWEPGFLRALDSSLVFVPLLSRGSLALIENPKPGVKDHFLHEIEIALARFENKHSSIFPLFVADQSEDRNSYNKLNDLHVDKFPDIPSQTLPTSTVRETMGKLLKIQGVNCLPDNTRSTVSDIVDYLTTIPNVKVKKAK